MHVRFLKMVGGRAATLRLRFGRHEGRMRESVKPLSCPLLPTLAPNVWDICSSGRLGLLPSPLWGGVGGGGRSKDTMPCPYRTERTSPRVCGTETSTTCLRTLSAQQRPVAQRDCSPCDVLSRCLLSVQFRVVGTHRQGPQALSLFAGRVKKEPARLLAPFTV